MQLWFVAGGEAIWVKQTATVALCASVHKFLPDILKADGAGTCTVLMLFKGVLTSAIQSHIFVHQTT